MVIMRNPKRKALSTPNSLIQRELPLEESQTSPPYGPTEGMLQGIRLLQKTTPPKVDGPFLRSHKIAPGNEYKVIGALKYLRFIDEYGRPTERSRFLKTHGATSLLALQDAVQNSYHKLIEHIKQKGATRESIFNYFVTEENMGTEMAAKATRFFIALVQMAQLDLGTALSNHRTSAKAAESKTQQRQSISHHLKEERGAKVLQEGFTPPLLFTITPEMQDMDLEHMTELFRKIRIALKHAFAEAE